MDRRLILAGIVGLGLVLRLAGLGDRLSDAEGYSWLVASAPSIDVFFDRLAAYENTPPLFYALLAPLPLDDEAWLRLPALIAAVASIPVLYCLVRPLLGTRVASLAALGLAVAPFHVSYSNYSRGFMLAGLGLLLAAWGVARLAQGRPGTWWWLYVAGGILAMHSEYYSILFLAPLLGVLLMTRARPLREVVGFGVVPALTLLPLVGEMQNAIDQLDKTKISPIYPEPSLSSLRDTTVSFFFGEHGTAASAGARSLQFLLLAAVLVVAGRWLWRGRWRLGEVEAGSRRLAFWLLAAVPAGTVLLHVIVAFPGPDIFETRYLTGLIPFATALLAAGVVAVPWRWSVPLVTVVLLGLSLAVFAKRYDRELEPDFTAAGSVIEERGARTVLTNSAVVVFYLGDPEPILDRPFSLGDGAEARCRVRCPKPLAIVDDTRQGSGARLGLGERVPVGPIEVRFPPARASAAGGLSR